MRCVVKLTTVIVFIPRAFYYPFETINEGSLGKVAVFQSI